MSRNTNTEFIKIIETEVQRISPNLSLSLKSSNPLSQVIEIIRLSIDTLVEEKKSLEQEYTRFSHGSSPISSHDSEESQQTKSKLLQIQKELSKFENLLNEKGKRLEKREDDLNTLSEALNKQKFAIDKDKLMYEAKYKEYEMKIKGLLEKESNLKAAQELLVSERSRFEQEKEKNFVVNKKSPVNSIEVDDAMEKMKIAQIALQKDIEKYNFEYKILEEKEQALSLKQGYLIKTAEDLKKKKKALDEEKVRMYNEREGLLKLKQDVSQERVALLEEKQETERSLRSSDSRTLEKISNSTMKEEFGANEIISLYEGLRSQIEVFNHEVEVKEKDLQNKEKKLLKDQQKISNYFSEIIQIKTNLISVKNEIQDFYAQIIPEIEKIHKTALITLEQLNTKFIEMESLCSRMGQSNFLFPSMKDDSKSPRAQAHYKSKTIPAFNIDGSQIGILTKELEQNLEAVKRKERELDIKLAKMKSKRERFSDMKKKILIARNEIHDEKEKLKIQSYQLDAGLKALIKKESEISQYRQELDKRANMLEIKESQSHLKRIHLSRHDSLADN